MRLQKLEIKGFKSFADNTSINFNEDVIGVVGPNGCGKSNIVDAIRWVLGEQSSKELRSDKMSSVIFNGTRKRKQGGLAQVSLTFENTKNLLPTEYHTVTITRLLYRSGESEYRLNNVTCRLKDINSLLMDTGIGSNSYAIIALGMVDDLLADRENSRRRMLEQAAGISKYKIRKRETLNKLKLTTDDLERIEDLLFEIEGNLETLEKQAKRAKKYFELKENYKTFSIDLAILQVNEYKENYKNLKTKITEEEDRKRTLEVEATQLEAQLEASKKDNLDNEKLLAEKQRLLNDLVGKIRNMENDKRVFEQKVQFIRQNTESLKINLESANSRLQTVDAEIQSYLSQVESEKSIEGQLEGQLKEAEAKLASIKENHGSLKSELDDFIQNQQELERQIFEKEKQLAINANQVLNLKNDVLRFENEVKQRQGEMSGFSEKLNELEKVQTEKTKLLTDMEEQENQRQTQLTEKETQLDDLKQQIVSLNRKLDARKNEHQLTKSLVDNLEGFPESIKFLNKSKTWKTGALLLSDIIYCKEEYRVAIENYLEPYLNYYVVKNLKEAYSAIDLLTKSNMGKANFFLLDEMPEPEIFDRIPPLEGTISALDVLNIDDKYKKLANFLLGKVMILEDNQADAMPVIQDGKNIVLSKDGRFSRKKFSISGGSVGLFEGKRIGRKRNLQILDKEIKKLEKEGKTLNDAFEKLQEDVETLKASSRAGNMQEEREFLNKISGEVIQLRTRVENFQSFIQETETKKTGAQNQIISIEKNDIEVNAALTLARQNAASTQSQMSQMDGSYQLVAQQMSDASAAYNQKNIEFIRQQNKIASLERELSFRQNQKAESQNQLSSGNKTLEQSDIEMKQVLLDIENLEKELLENYDVKNERSTDLAEFEQSYYKGRGGINELEDNLRKLNKQRQDTLILITELNNKFSNVKLQMNSIGERLKIEFGLDINEVMNQEPTTDMDIRQLDSKVYGLKRRLDNYGEINPMAVEAYDEMKERYDTINTQREDILEAKDSLLQTIDEIETTATEQFLEAFNQVRVNFQEVFRNLFTENDSADMLLEDPEQPLDCRILITAKPKGKRPQTINQLSGGEKTLTATALLFALYLLKPAPFCIFDEVDAPLDDANIAKFNRIIKKFSEDSQFIIVTHNKQTMAAVDIIYGVTMAEQGVSSVVPVDFRALN